jgi:hypothetical protein
MKYVVYVFLVCTSVLLSAVFAHASSSVGTITPGSNIARVCKDTSCASFGRVNFLPTLNSNTTGALPITITDSGITGHAWGDEIGWINMNPTGAGVSVNPINGTLSGFAYASVGSWINFNPTGGGVSLVDNGTGSNFSGYAWVSGVYGGWLKFDCSSVNTCVTTDWRIQSLRATSTSTTTPSGGSGGGGSGTKVSTPVTSPAIEPLLTGPAYVSAGAVVTVVMSNVPTLVREVRVLVRGANSASILLTPISPGVFAGTYVAKFSGTDLLTGFIDGEPISVDGVIGGTVRVAINELPKVEDVTPLPPTPQVPQKSLPPQASAPYTPQIAPPQPSQATNERPIVTERHETTALHSLPFLEYLFPFLEKARPVFIATGIFFGFLASLFGLSGTPFSVTNIGYLITHGWSNLLGYIFFWRKRRPWGTVYDSVTKLPLDPAYVELINEKNETVAEAITDLDGRYGFLVAPGFYTMRVQKSHYQFPSKRRVLTGHDVIYTNIYFGEKITMGNAVTYDIPMDPLEFDWNQQEKLRTHQFRFIKRFDPLLAQIATFLLLVGFGSVLWQIWVTPNIYAVLIAALYTFLLMLRYTRGKPVLYGTITKNGEPLQFAAVHIYRGKDEVASKITDAYGRYVALLAPFTYRIKIDERISDGVYELAYEQEIRTKDGVINPRISL